MAKTKKQRIKVREIPSKIKEVKVIEKSESELEKEVEEIERMETGSMDFAPSGNFQAPILKSEEPEQQLPEQSQENQVREREAAPTTRTAGAQFRETATYSISQQNFTSTETAKYILPGESASLFRSNSTLFQSNRDSGTTRTVNDFRGEQARSTGSQNQSENYSKIVDAPSERPKRKYPWEA